MCTWTVYIDLFIYIYIYTDALMTWLVNFRLTTGDLQGIFATNKRKQLMIILGFQRLKETLSLTLISKAVDSFFLVNNMFYRSSSVVNLSVCVCVCTGHVLAKDPTMIDIPIKADKAPGGFETRSFPILDVHRLMHVLITTIGIEIPPSRVKAFWQTHREELREDWAVFSPATPDHIPFALYGDSAKILDDGTKIVGLFVSLPQVWRPRSSRCARWCIFALEEHKFYKNVTLDTVLRQVVYSCNLLFHGFDPDTPAATLANGRQFIVTELKGDWAWHKWSLRFRSSWQRLDSVCFWCNAKGRSNNPGDLYYCLDERPNWQQYNLVTFLAEQMGDPDP